MSLCQKLIEDMTGLVTQYGVIAALCSLRCFWLSANSKSMEFATHLQPNLQSHSPGSFSAEKEGKHFLTLLNKKE